MFVFVAGHGLAGVIVFEQLFGTLCFVQSADQPETWKRCSGRLHEELGSNMRSCSTKFCAYVQ